MADTAPILQCVSDRGHVLSLLWPPGATHLHVYHGYQTTRPVVFRRPRLPYEAQRAFLATLPPDVVSVVADTFWYLVGNTNADELHIALSRQSHTASGACFSWFCL